jgi:hypothetical protein
MNQHERGGLHRTPKGRKRCLCPAAAGPQTKTKSPPTSAICDCSHTSALNEFTRVTFCKKLYRSIEELQGDVDPWFPEYMIASGPAGNSAISGFGGYRRRKLEDKFAEAFEQSERRSAKKRVRIAAWQQIKARLKAIYDADRDRPIPPRIIGLFDKSGGRD